MTMDEEVQRMLKSLFRLIVKTPCTTKRRPDFAARENKELLGSFFSSSQLCARLSHDVLSQMLHAKEVFESESDEEADRRDSQRDRRHHQEPAQERFTLRCRDVE